MNFLDPQVVSLCSAYHSPAMCSLIYSKSCSLLHWKEELSRPEHRLSENYSSHLVWKWVLFFSLINKTQSLWMEILMFSFGTLGLTVTHSWTHRRWHMPLWKCFTLATDFSDPFAFFSTNKEAPKPVFRHTNIRVGVNAQKTQSFCF